MRTGQLLHQRVQRLFELHRQGGRLPVRLRAHLDLLLKDFPQQPVLGSLHQ